MNKLLLTFSLIFSISSIAQEQERKVEKVTLETEIRSIGPELKMIITELPVYGQIQADFENLNPKDLILINVFDMEGKEVFQGQTDGNGSSTHVFDFKTVEPGDYFLRIFTVRNNATAKITLR